MASGSEPIVRTDSFEIDSREYTVELWGWPGEKCRICGEQVYRNKNGRPLYEDEQAQVEDWRGGCYQCAHPLYGGLANRKLNMTESCNGLSEHSAHWHRTVLVCNYDVPSTTTVNKYACFMRRVSRSSTLGPVLGQIADCGSIGMTTMKFMIWSRRRGLRVGIH